MPNNEDLVSAALATATKPLSAYDLLQALHGTTIKAAAQVYRALDRLMSEGKVHRIESLNAFVVCGCEHKRSSPGFMLCTCCGGVKEFDAGKTMKAVQGKLEGFKIETPRLEMKGLCANCQVEDHRHG